MVGSFARLIVAILGLPGGMLGASWGNPEASWDGRLEMSVRVPPLGPPLGAVLGPSWAVLGRLGGFLGPG
eukprot:5192071-Pyramimonas_sp.AAC.1